MMKLNLSNQVKNCLKSQLLIETEVWTRCFGLEKLNLSDGQHLGTAESSTRIYDLRAFKNDGSMVRIHNQSQWIIRLEGRENEADRLERIETGKWLLSKGVITAEQAKEEYGYEGLTN